MCTFETITVATQIQLMSHVDCKFTRTNIQGIESE